MPVRCDMFINSINSQIPDKRAQEIMNLLFLFTISDPDPDLTYASLSFIKTYRTLDFYKNFITGIMIMNHTSITNEF